MKTQNIVNLYYTPHNIYTVKFFDLITPNSNCCNYPQGEIGNAIMLSKCHTTPQSAFGL